MTEQPKSCCAPARSGDPAALPPKGETVARSFVAQPRPGAGSGEASVPSRLRNLVTLRGGRSFVGTDHPEIPQDGEGPRRQVMLADFALEAETVTVARFAEFVAATGYVTEAERYGWSSVFSNDPGFSAAARSLGGNLPWWHIVEGADWAHPEGPKSGVEDRADHPVTQVSWRDAEAFAHWAGGRLPSEAEWEHAARGGSDPRRFPWGEAEPDDETVFCNIWQGRFPQENTARDGYARTAPARSFAPNPAGLYNMVGNVWEWVADPFRVRSLARAAQLRNKQAAREQQKVLKGGSFLCHISYCYRYRIAARMGLSPDSATSNVGFRIAARTLPAPACHCA